MNQFSLFEEESKKEIQEPLFSELQPQDVDWKQNTLFDVEPKWKELWIGMPDFTQVDQQAFQSINVHFRNREDRNQFAELVGQKITNDTQYVWFPKQEISDLISKRYVSKAIETNPRYPVYVISKGRWESRLTARALDAINVPYKIVIEPQEFLQYSQVIDPEKILQLPFSNLGQGSIPARNWVWEHSISIGAERHWILDDNIGAFSRLHNNQKIRVADGMIFRAAAHVRMSLLKKKEAKFRERPFRHDGQKKKTKWPSSKYPVRRGTRISLYLSMFHPNTRLRFSQGN
jgi:hypothetical protein